MKIETKRIHLPAIIVAVMLIPTVIAHCQVTAGIYHKCPIGGTKTTATRIQTLNVQKNRAAEPTDADIDPSFTMQALLKTGNDEHRFNTAKAGELTAFVVDVKPGGVESVNCGATDPVYRDTHIELALSMNAPETEWVIVEVTPRWRQAMKAKGIDWSTKTLKALKGQQVTFRGWQFADTEHDPQARNTNPSNVHDWRATVWELHPVTRITLLGDPCP